VFSSFIPLEGGLSSPVFIFSVLNSLVPLVPNSCGSNG
jgi:hypothetical protein